MHEEDDTGGKGSNENEETSDSPDIWLLATLPYKFYEQHKHQENHVISSNCQCARCESRAMDDIQKKLLQCKVAGGTHVASSTRLSVNEAVAQAAAVRNYSDYTSNVSEKQLKYSKPPSWYRQHYSPPKAEVDDGELIDEELYKMMGFTSFYSNKEEWFESKEDLDDGDKK